MATTNLAFDESSTPEGQGHYETVPRVAVSRVCHHAERSVSRLPVEKSVGSSTALGFLCKQAFQNSPPFQEPCTALEPLHG